jgi:hypothetical protein
MEKRTRVLIKDLPSSIPSVPVFEGEDSLDIAAESSSFLNGFARAIQNQDWQAFGNLFADDCWWKDSLTLTFDKRTLRGHQAIVVQLLNRSTKVEVLGAGKVDPQGWRVEDLDPCHGCIIT